MSITQLKSGRWRAQVYHQRKNVTVGTFDTKREAKKAREEKRAQLAAADARGVSVTEFRDRWLTDPLFARPKQSTMRHNRYTTKLFAQKYGALPLTSVNDDIVAEWL